MWNYQISEWDSVLKVEMTTELRGLPSVQTGLGRLHVQRLSTFGTPPDCLPLELPLTRKVTRLHWNSKI